MDQGRRHAGIDTAGQTQDHLLVAHLRADGGHGLGDVVAHHPVRLRAADAQHKALQHRPALHRVRHLRVELHGVVATRLVGHASNGAAGRAGHELEAGWQLGHLVTVAHPDLEHAVALGGAEVLDAVEQPRVATGPHLGVAELTVVAPLHLAAELYRHGLHAIADAQHGHAQIPHRLRRAKLVVFVGAGVAAGQDHALGRKRADELVRHVVRVDLAVDVRFAHAAGDQLRDLGAEVEDKNLVVHGHLVDLKWSQASSRAMNCKAAPKYSGAPMRQSPCGR